MCALIREEHSIACYSLWRGGDIVALKRKLADDLQTMILAAWQAGKSPIPQEVNGVPDYYALTYSVFRRFSRESNQIPTDDSNKRAHAADLAVEMATMVRSV